MKVKLNKNYEMKSSSLLIIKNPPGSRSSRFSSDFFFFKAPRDLEFEESVEVNRI